MSLKLPDLQVTSFASPVASTVVGGLANDDGLMIIGWYNGLKGANETTAPTTASIFAPGCILFCNLGTSATSGLMINSGTTASPTWTRKTIN